MKNKKNAVMIAVLTLVVAAAISMELFTSSPAGRQTEDKVSEKITVESGTFYHDATDASQDNNTDRNDISSSGRLKIGVSIKDR